MKGISIVIHNLKCEFEVEVVTGCLLECSEMNIAGIKQNEHTTEYQFNENYKEIENEYWKTIAIN